MGRCLSLDDSTALSNISVSRLLGVPLCGLPLYEAFQGVRPGFARALDVAYFVSGARTDGDRRPSFIGFDRHTLLLRLHSN